MDRVSTYTNVPPIDTSIDDIGALVQDYNQKNVIPVWKFFVYGICILFFIIGIVGLVYVLLQKNPSKENVCPNCSPGQICDKPSDTCYHPGDPNKINLPLPSSLNMSYNIKYNDNMKGGTAWCSPTFYRLYVVDTNSNYRTPWFPDENYAKKDSTKVKQDSEGNYYFGPVQLDGKSGCYDINGDLLNWAEIIIKGVPSDYEQKGMVVNVFMYGIDEKGDINPSSEIFMGNLYGSSSPQPGTAPNPSPSSLCCKNTIKK